MNDATNASAGCATSCAAVPSWRRRPSTMTPMRSASAAASRKSWVTSSVGSARAARTSCSSLRTTPRVWASSAESGSSSRRTRGSRARARATATRWRSPPESPPGRSSARSAICTRSSSSATRASLAPPKATLRRTVMCGKSAYSWKTRPTERRSGGRSTLACGVEPCLVAEGDAPAVGAPQAGDRPQDRRLAGSGGPDERDGLRSDAQADAELERAKADGDVELEVLHEEKILYESSTPPLSTTSSTPMARATSRFDSSCS